MDASPRNRIADYCVYLLVRIFICIVQSMRIETCATVSRFLAWIAADVVRIRRATVERNLTYIFPEMTARRRASLTRRMWYHLFIMVCEIAHVPRKIHDTNFRRYVNVHNRRQMISTMLAGRPVILVTGHFGNFEVGGYLTGVLGFETHAVARTLDNPYLNDFVRLFREGKGQFLLPKEGSAGEATEILKRGGVLSLLADQYAGRKGCWVQFANRPTSCHKAIALFSLMNKAPMMAAYCRRTSGPLQFELGCRDVADPMDPELGDVKSITQWYNTLLEELVVANPEQYWWVHRRWRDPPAPRTRRAKAA